MRSQQRNSARTSSAAASRSQEGAGSLPLPVMGGASLQDSGSRSWSALSSPSYDPSVPAATARGRWSGSGSGGEAEEDGPHSQEQSPSRRRGGAGAPLPQSPPPHARGRAGSTRSASGSMFETPSAEGDPVAVGSAGSPQRTQPPAAPARGHRRSAASSTVFGADAAQEGSGAGSRAAAADGAASPARGLASRGTAASRTGASAAGDAAAASASSSFSSSRAYRSILFDTLPSPSAGASERTSLTRSAIHSVEQSSSSSSSSSSASAAAVAASAPAHQQHRGRSEAATLSPPRAARAASTASDDLSSLSPVSRTSSASGASSQHQTPRKTRLLRPSLRSPSSVSHTRALFTASEAAGDSLLQRKTYDSDRDDNSSVFSSTGERIRGFGLRSSASSVGSGEGSAASSRSVSSVAASSTTSSNSPHRLLAGHVRTVLYGGSSRARAVTAASRAQLGLSDATDRTDVTHLLRATVAAATALPVASSPRLATSAAAVPAPVAAASASASAAAEPTPATVATRRSRAAAAAAAATPAPAALPVDASAGGKLSPARKHSGASASSGSGSGSQDGGSSTAATVAPAALFDPSAYHTDASAFMDSDEADELADRSVSPSALFAAPPSANSVVRTRRQRHQEQLGLLHHHPQEKAALLEEFGVRPTVKFVATSTSSGSGSGSGSSVGAAMVDAVMTESAASSAAATVTAPASSATAASADAELSSSSSAGRVEGEAAAAAQAEGEAEDVPAPPRKRARTSAAGASAPVIGAKEVEPDAATVAAAAAAAAAAVPVLVVQPLLPPPVPEPADPLSLLPHLTPVQLAALPLPSHFGALYDAFCALDVVLALLKRKGRSGGFSGSTPAAPAAAVAAPSSSSSAADSSPSRSPGTSRSSFSSAASSTSASSSASSGGLSAYLLTLSVVAEGVEASLGRQFTPATLAHMLAVAPGCLHVDYRYVNTKGQSLPVPDASAPAWQRAQGGFELIVDANPGYPPLLPATGPPANPLDRYIVEPQPEHMLSSVPLPASIKNARGPAQSGLPQSAASFASVFGKGGGGTLRGRTLAAIAAAAAAPTATTPAASTPAAASSAAVTVADTSTASILTPSRTRRAVVDSGRSPGASADSWASASSGAVSTVSVTHSHSSTRSGDAGLPDPVNTATAGGAGGSGAVHVNSRRDAFRAALLAVVDAAHAAFLRQQGITHTGHRAYPQGSWHQDFDLQTVPLPSADLPQQPVLPEPAAAPAPAATRSHGGGGSSRGDAAADTTVTDAEIDAFVASNTFAVPPEYKGLPKRLVARFLLSKRKETEAAAATAASRAATIGSSGSQDAAAAETLPPRLSAMLSRVLDVVHDAFAGPPRRSSLLLSDVIAHLHKHLRQLSEAEAQQCVQELVRLVPTYAAIKSVQLAGVAREHVRLLPQTSPGFLGQVKKVLQEAHAARASSRPGVART